MPRKAKAAVEDEGPDKGWLESFADGMTLLMSFFVMLYAFALVDLEKFQDFKVGMTASLGVSDPVNEQANSLLDTGDGIAGGGKAPVPSQELRNQIEQVQQQLEETGTVTPENAEEVQQLLEAGFEELGASPYTFVSIDERGVFVRFDQRLLFRSGSADLGTDSDAVLLAMNEVLQAVDNPVDVEGHTDNVPTGGKFFSNWELSSSRASAVVRWLIDRKQIPPGRFAAVGMADTRPIASNNNEDGRSQNRRVEIVLRVDGIDSSDVPVINPILGDPGSVQKRDGTDEMSGSNTSDVTNEEALNG